MGSSDSTLSESTPYRLPASAACNSKTLPVPPYETAANHLGTAHSIHRGSGLERVHSHVPQRSAREAWSGATGQYGPVLPPVQPQQPQHQIRIERPAVQPQQPQQPQRIERPAVLGQPKDKAKEVIRCATLLREMFVLDLKIWSSQSAKHARDREARRAMERQADDILREVRDIVKRWEEKSDIKWTPDEQKLVDQIMSEIYSHDEERYASTQ